MDLTCLTKHFSPALDLLAEAILEPAFDENEFRKLRDRNLRALELEEQKTEFICRREFSEKMFGKEHPYGRTARKEYYEAILLDDISNFHSKNYSPSGMTFVVSGKFNPEEISELLNKKFGVLAGGEKNEWKNSRAAAPPAEAMKGRFHFPRPDSKQASLRAGHRTFDRHHPDFHPMDLTNMLFGGYFGSRLMKNIREEKGFTYGVYAYWLSLKFSGYFMVQTEVGVEYLEQTFEEIRKEMKLLLEKGTTDEELEVVRNYKLGKTISGRETPSQMVDLISTCLVNEIPFSDLDRKFEVIRAVTKEQVVELARKYYQPENLLEVSCGGN
jgi:predicted Zn-dependent peptidase